MNNHEYLVDNGDNSLDNNETAKEHTTDCSYQQDDPTKDCSYYQGTRLKSVDLFPRTYGTKI